MLELILRSIFFMFSFIISRWLKHLNFALFSNVVLVFWMHCDKYFVNVVSGFTIMTMMYSHWEDVCLDVKCDKERSCRQSMTWCVITPKSTVFNNVQPLYCMLETANVTSVVVGRYWENVSFFKLMLFELFVKFWYNVT